MAYDIQDLKISETYQTLYKDIKDGISKNSPAKKGAPLHIARQDEEKKGDIADKYDHYFFVQWTNSINEIGSETELEKIKKQKKEELEKILIQQHITQSIWSKISSEGITDKYKDIVFRCVTKHKKFKTIDVALRDYIYFAEVLQKANLYGTQNHKELVNEFLKEEKTLRNTNSIIDNTSVNQEIGNPSNSKPSNEKQDPTNPNENKNTTSDNANSSQFNSPSGFTRNLHLKAPPEIESIHYYANKEQIDIVGRKKEQKILLGFLDCDKPYAWFQLAGVAGQGKSRLALDLIGKAKERDWEAGLLDDVELEEMVEHWREWKPQKPHLIILDYVVGRLDKIRSCLQGLHYNNHDHPPIKVLLLERQAWNKSYSIQSNQNNNFDNNPSFEFSQSFAEWFSSLSERGDGHDDYLTNNRYNPSLSDGYGILIKPGVLELKEMTPDELVSIVKDVAQHKSDDKKLSDKQIKKLLHSIDKEGRPLYAYFLGQELLCNTNIHTGWSRNDLLTSVLKREQNRWWGKMINTWSTTPYIELFQWNVETDSSSLALLATITGGVNYDSSTQAKFLPKLKGVDRRKAIVLTGGMLNANHASPKYVPAMQPDLLGEWYVISSYNEDYPMESIFNTAWNYAPKQMAGFVLKLIQDFPEEPIIEVILEGINLEKIDTLTIADTLNGCLAEYHSKTKIIPNKLTEIIQINASKKHTPSLRQLGILHSFGIGVEKNMHEAFRLFQKAADLGDAIAKISLGLCYQYGKGIEKDIDKAVSLFREIVELGGVVAKTYLGVCYQHGIGVEKDIDEAVKLYKEAAEFGDNRAKTNLGFCYENGTGVQKDIDEAIRLYREAAEFYDAGAKTNLGICYQNGTGVQKDIDEAIKLYKEAAESGDATAKINLGICYLYGIGVEKDIDGAVKLYKEAAESGDDRAKTYLGVCYQHGIGVEKDIDEAIKLFKEAADSDDTEAKTNLGFCYENGTGVQKDIDEAIKLYKEAVESGNARAKTYLGVCYQHGIGVEKDIDEAIKLYKEAAESGDARAKTYLGVCYQNGTGIEKDIDEVIKLYKEATESGDAVAKTYLGVCYQNGTGVEKNIDEAIKLFKEAAESGYAVAKTYLGICYQNGTGVEKNIDEAIKLYKEAAESGDNRAKVNLGVYYAYRTDVEKDIDEAIKLFKEAAESGDAKAKINLGFCYTYGTGVKKDTEEAYRLFREAAESGDATAKTNLGVCFENGTGVAKDINQAVRLYHEASKLGEHIAQERLISLQFALGLLEKSDCTDTIDKDWAEQQITHFSSEKWRTKPLNIGNWEQPLLQDTLQILIDFHHILRIAEQLEQLNNIECVRLRMTSLSFYPELSLVEIELFSLEKNISLFTHALYGSNGVTPLNGNSNIINTLNPKFLSFKSEQACIEYLNFFCKFAHGDKGAFHVISNLNDSILTMRQKKKLPEIVKQSFFPVRYVNGMMKTDGWQRFEVCVIYDRCLFKATLRLFADGNVEMESGDEIEENLPTIHYQYDGIFCYQSSDE